MGGNTEPDINRIKRILLEKAPLLLAAYPDVLFAYLYGSYARGEAHVFSDVDVAVYIGEEALGDSLGLELSLSLDMDRLLRPGAQSEVRVLNRLPLAVVGPIVTEGVLIYCKEDTERVDFETRTRMAYFDFRIFLNEYQKQYLESYRTAE